MKEALHCLSIMVGLLLCAACTTTLPQAAGPHEQSRMFEQPFAVVWEGVERVMRGKQAMPALIDRDAGLLRVSLADGTQMTAFLEAVSAHRTRVYVRRSRTARTPVSESAILDEIASAIGAASR